MAAVLFLIQQSIPVEGILQLILMVVFGGLTYAGMLWFLNREALMQGVSTIRSVLQRKKPSPKTILEGVSHD